MFRYLRFLARMGFKDPKTFFNEFANWNRYSFLPGNTQPSRSPLPVLRCEDVEEAVRIFYRDGFVVLSDGLTVEQAERLRVIVKQKADGIVKADEEGRIRPETKHGDKRYSFAEYGPSPEWEYLAHNDRVLPIVKAIWKGRAFRAIAAGGDFVLPGGTWQHMHNDMLWRSAGELLPRVVIVNYYVSNVQSANGPIRQVPGTARFPIPMLTIEREPQWMKESIVTGKPGYVVLRDPRTWHGGTPNTSTEPRYMPNVEYALRDVSIEEIGGTLNMAELKRGNCIAEFANP